MSLPRPNRLIRSIKLPSRSRLCWRIMLVVFMAIFVVEAAILIPSYQNYERDLLARINDVGRNAMSAALVLHGNNSERDMSIIGSGLVRISNIRGGAI